MNPGDRVKVRTDLHNILEFLKGKEGVVVSVDANDRVTVELEGVGLTGLLQEEVEVVMPPPPAPKRNG